LGRCKSNNTNNDCIPGTELFNSFCYMYDV